ncbi:right-handed parallel beta-helix repeat-containing protein [Paenibacillus sp. WQ 127069]|uniref:Right-handed parallel beta-helix repeat-containing protein n=1 Tax=Paenibacillus baimaensis TaxID=2982185 RepID=A0ABT2UD59_9BACL|nr:right-handed parallel beta-helix repeat-containing protein [Paenibacillus sp. WQ 127069]MCU6792583.1 right-handed parallel beta-helix repeat-containing protein [Paenibacillus sp. WQ 127069]
MQRLAKRLWAVTCYVMLMNMFLIGEPAITNASPSANVYYQTVWQDNFDSLETGSGVAWDALTPSVLPEGSSVTAEVYGEGGTGKMMRIVDNDAGTIGTFKKFGTQLHKMIAEASIRIDPTTNNAGSFQFYLLDDSLSTSGLVTSMGILKNEIRWFVTSGGTTTTTVLTPNGFDGTQWNDFRIEADVSLKTADLYLNGQLIGDDLPFRRATASNIGRIWFVGGASPSPVIAYVDNVRIKGEMPVLFSENFDSLTTGSGIAWDALTPSVLPAGSSVTVGVYGKGDTGKMMRIVDNDPGTIGTFKKFGTQLHQMIAEASIRIDPATNNTGSFQFYLLDDSTSTSGLVTSMGILKNEIRWFVTTGGTTTTTVLTPSGFDGTHWNDFRIEADVSLKTADLYLNGQLIGDNLPFRRAVASNIGRIWFVGGASPSPVIAYVDNVSIYGAAAGSETTPEVPIVTTPSPIPTRTPYYERTTTQIQSNLYVAPNGDDENPGTEEQPFASIQGAKDYIRTINGNMTGDIVVHLKQGNYYVDDTIAFDAADSGTNNYYIIYKNDDELGSARLVGGRKIKEWMPDQGSIWKANVGQGWSFETLYENGQRARKARTPNYVTNNSFLNSNAPYLTSESGTVSSITYKSGDLDTSNWDISDSDLVVWPWGYRNWGMWTSPITAIDANSRTISISNGDGTVIGPEARYYVEGIYQLLDQPGEFYLDRDAGMLYYWPMNGDPDDQTIVAPKVQTLISLAGSSANDKVQNIAFEGLTFEGTDFTKQINAWYQNPETRKGMMNMSNTENIVIRNSHLKNAGLFGIYMHNYNQYNRVVGCWIEQMGISGILLRAETGTGDVLKYNILTNNKIHDVGQLATDSSGINIYNAGFNEISYSEIFNGPRFAISFRGPTGQDTSSSNKSSNGYTRNNIVKYVKVYKTNQDSGDTGAIHQAGTSKQYTDAYNTNYYDQIVINDIYSHPSNLDLGPNGMFFDYNTFGQVFKNIKITNVQGNALAMEFRYNDSGKGYYENVNWLPGYNENLIDLVNIGLRDDFPTFNYSYFDKGGIHRRMKKEHDKHDKLKGNPFEISVDAILKYDNNPGY